MVEEKKGEEISPEIDKVETLAPIVDVKAILAEKSRLESELQQVRKGFGTVQQTLAQKERELSHRQALEDEIAELKELVAASLEMRGVDSDTPSSIKDLLGGLDKKKQDRESARRMQAEQESRQSYNLRADAVWSRAQLAFADDPDTQEDIKELLGNGLIGMADRQVSKIEKRMKSSSKVSETDRQKEIDESARKMLEEQGQLSKTSVSPSSGGGKKWTVSEITAMDTQTYLKNFPGGGADIMRLDSEGKIIDK